MALKLNIPVIDAALMAKGLNQTELADLLGVSKGLVSQWLSGKVAPLPARAVRLAMVLGQSIESIASPVQAMPTPLVAYRRKGHQKTKSHDYDRAVSTGEALEALTPFLPPRRFDPPKILNTSLEYANVEQTATQFRARMGLGPTEPVTLPQLRVQLKELEAIIVPVFWGRKENHGNALHVLLPASGHTFVFLNLDSQELDFKFWVTHEIGHILTPALVGTDEGEDFADIFAESVLFPQAAAQGAYKGTAGLPKGAVVNKLKAVAVEYGVSLLTVHKRICQWANQFGLPVSQFELGNSLHGACQNLNKLHQSISQKLFAKAPVPAAEYIAVTELEFGTPIFSALRQYIHETDADASLVARILDVPFADGVAVKHGLLSERAQEPA